MPAQTSAVPIKSTEPNKLYNKRNFWCFSLGTFGRDFAYNLFVNNLLTFILFTKTLTDLQFSFVSAIIIVARIFDAFNDPIMGGIVENTRTRFGKFRPWILIGGVSTCLIIVLLFSVPVDNWAFIGFLAVMYLTFSNLNLLGTYWAPAIAVASGSVPFIVVTLRPYFKSIPVSLDEAARIDGCGVFRSFFKIMIPTIKTGIITVVVISFLNGWNDLLYSMTFNVDADMRPLTANIRKFQSKYGTRWNCIMAYGAILVIPVILAFIFLQKYIVGGLTAGAVKE